MATEMLHLSFRMMTEKTFSHSMDASLLISDVKAIIETDSEIAPENQRLIFKGQLLRDECSLKSYGVESGSTIHVVGKVRNMCPDGEGVSGSGDTTVGQDNGENMGGRTDSAGAENQANAAGAMPRGFGYPMGIFMSPIYATISVSAPGNPNQGEHQVEQVASQFFSGVVNSFLNSFNPMQQPTTNAGHGRDESAAVTHEDELVHELESSTSVLSRVSNTLKVLNGFGPSSNTGSPNSNGSAVVNENFNGITVEFRGMETPSESREGSSLEVEREAAEGFEVNGRRYTSEPSLNHGEGTESEECSRTGKVLLMDPEVLSSKLPWESLNKLEQLVDETPTISRSSSGISLSNRDVAIRSPSANYLESRGEPENTPGGSVSSGTLNGNNETPTSSFNTQNITPESVRSETGSETYRDFLRRFQSIDSKLKDVMRDYDVGDRGTQLERFRRLSSAMAIKARIDASLCALFSWMQTKLVCNQRSRAFSAHMGWSMNGSGESMPSQTSGEFGTNSRMGSQESGSATLQGEVPAGYVMSDPGAQTEMDVDQVSAEGTQVYVNHAVSDQAQLFARYRASPEFEARMERVRQTKLSDSYHNS